jgi:hypothetical protein
MSGERWLADVIEMHRRLTFVDKNSKEKKNSGRHYSLQVADLQKYKPTLSFVSPQKFSLSPKSYSLPP